MAYLKQLGLGVALIAAVSGTLCLLIDPYDIFDMPHIAGFNDVKTLSTPRYVKPLQLTARQPTVVFLGSSRVEVGLDPSHVANAFNMGIPSAVASEMHAYGAHAMAVAPVKRFVVGLDFFSFNDDRPPPPAFDPGLLGRFNIYRSLPVTLFSFEALNRARKSLRRSWKGKKVRYQSNGLFDMPDVPGAAEPMVHNTLASYLGPNGLYNRVNRISRSLSDFESFITLARDNGATVDAFISPVHAALMEALDQSDQWPLYEEWKRALARLSAQNGATLTDFSGYTQLTTAPLATARNTFIDLVHYRPAVGRRILAELASDFSGARAGTRIAPATIEAHLAMQRIQRDAYRSHNDRDLKTITKHIRAFLARKNSS